MNNKIVKDKFLIENLIYEIRGKQVMLDSDLAKLYECKNGTKEINQAVKNNIEKFPERYAFRISEEESKTWSQKIWLQVWVLMGDQEKDIQFLLNIFNKFNKW